MPLKMGEMTLKRGTITPSYPNQEASAIEFLRCRASLCRGSGVSAITFWQQTALSISKQDRRFGEGITRITLDRDLMKPLISHLLGVTLRQAPGPTCLPGPCFRLCQEPKLQTISMGKRQNYARRKQKLGRLTRQAQSLCPAISQLTIFQPRQGQRTPLT